MVLQIRVIDNWRSGEKSKTKTLSIRAPEDEALRILTHALLGLATQAPEDAAFNISKKGWPSETFIVTHKGYRIDPETKEGVEAIERLVKKATSGEEGES